MQMVYNSESFVVVRFDIGEDRSADESAARGGYEIVDKAARREIFIEGALAERFKKGDTTEALLDEYIAGFAGLAQQPVVLH